MSAPARGVGTPPISSKTSYHVTYNSIYLGLLDPGGCDCSGLKQTRYAIKTGTTGNTTLGHRVEGVEGTVKLKLRQIDQYQAQACAPWWSGTGAIPLCPPAGADTYSYAHVLLLHPEGAGDTTQDISFTKAVPQSVPVAVRDGTKEDVFPVEFDVYPDRTAMGSDLTATGVGTVANA